MQSDSADSADPSRIGRKLCWIWGALVIVSACVVALALAYLRAQAIDKGEALARSYAHVVEEQTVRLFLATDQRLQLAQIALKQLKASQPLAASTVNAMLTAQIKDQPYLGDMWVLDRQGRVVFDTHPGTEGLNLADRDFYSVFLTQPNTEFYLDTPVLSRRTGRLQFSVSRPLRSASGQLEGVLVAALEPSYFEALWRTVDLGDDGAVSLLRLDGTMLMRSPLVQSTIGKSFKHRTLFTTMLPRAANGVFTDTSSVDGVRRIFAYRTLPGRENMVLAVGVSHAFVLAAWYQLLALTLSIWGATAVVMGVLFRLLGQTWQRRLRADHVAHENELAWRTMFDSSPVAQMLQLPFAEIVNVNDQFVKLLGYARSELVGSLVNDLALRVPDALSEHFLATLKADARVQELELHVRCKDGSQRLVLISNCTAMWHGKLHHLHSLVDITEHRRVAEEALIGQKALEKISQGVLIAGPDRLTLSVNRAFEVLSGYTSAELVGQSRAFLQGPLTDSDTVARMRQALDAHEAFTGEVLNYRKDGTLYWSELSITPVLNSAGELAFFVGVHQDITQRKAQEVQLRLTEQVFNQSKEAFTVTDAQGNIVKVNKAFTEITGYSEAEVLGKNPRMLASGMQDAAFYKAMWSDIVTHGLWAGEILNRHKDGAIYPERLTISVMRDGQGETTHFLGSFNDLSREKAAERRIQRLSHFDPLTGLPNRALLQDRTAHAISMVQRAKEPLCMVLVSIDHFKTINDTLGHHVGDSVLIEVGQRLSGLVRDQDTVSHQSGKEFVLVLPGTPPEGAAHLATELLWALAQPYQLGGHSLEITASIGLASFPDNGGDFDTLFKSVEIAMHRAQSSGRDNFKFYSDGMYQEVLDRDQMIKALRLAAERGELQVLYQPFADLQTGKISGMEALLRWHHPERGTISPVVFIPVAEESGVIRAIGEWVLRRVCKDLRGFLDKGIDAPHVAVNVSPLQFRDPDLVGMVKTVLEEHAIPAHLIHLEVTESALMDDTGRSEAVLRELKALGFNLSLDDFGTGYSSLSYLKRFPFDKVKIDQSFVRDIGTSQTDTVIVKVIISMAHGLGLKVIAEGVETEAQCEIMRSNVCDEIQGYFFSRPVDVLTVESLLVDGRQLPAHLLRFRKQQRTLLLVDDEVNVVASLKRLLRRDGHHILSANSGAEGLEVLAKNKVDVIISDQRMPGMTGVEFLREAKLRYPDTIRIVLSGYTELQSVTDAINEGAIYRFLTKPWDDEQLRDQISKAFEHKELFEENQQLDIKIRTTNQELVAANRHLGDVLNSTRKQVDADATSLAIVQEALQYVPTPVIGLDDEDLIVFVNSAAEALFADCGPLLGAEMGYALPELAQTMDQAGMGQVGDLVVGGKRHQVRWNVMGKSSRARGKLVTLARFEAVP